MADNLNTVLREIISGMDKNALNRAVPELKKVLTTPEGRELVGKIKQTDREILARLIGEIKTNAKNGFEGISDNPEKLKRLIALLDGRE